MGHLFGHAHSAATGWAWTNNFTSLFGDEPGLVEGALILTYTWSQTPGAGFVLDYYLGDGAHGFYNSRIHSGSLDPTGSGSLYLPMMIGAGGAVHYGLQLAVNSMGNYSEYNDAEVTVGVDFAFLFPRGITPESTIGFGASEAVPAPGGAGLLVVAAAALAWRRRAG